jgi:hypothetical protein
MVLISWLVSELVSQLVGYFATSSLASLLPSFSLLVSDYETVTLAILITVPFSLPNFEEMKYNTRCDTNSVQ